MIELTEEQCLAVARKQAPRVVDPTTKTTYVLVRADLYERWQGLLGEKFEPPNAYPAVA